MCVWNFYFKANPLIISTTVWRPYTAVSIRFPTGVGYPSTGYGTPKGRAMPIRWREPYYGHRIYSIYGVRWTALHHGAEIFFLLRYGFALSVIYLFISCSNNNWIFTNLQSQLLPVRKIREIYCLLHMTHSMPFSDIVFEFIFKLL